MLVIVWERRDGKRSEQPLMQWETDVVPRVADAFVFLPPDGTESRRMLVCEVQWVGTPTIDLRGYCYVNLEVWDFNEMEANAEES